MSTTLISLPAELRQHILSLVFPDINHIGRGLPSQLITLLQTCRLIHDDTTSLLSTWSPLHYIYFPHQLHGLTNQSITVDGIKHPQKIERICLDIWHESSLSRMYWTCYCRGADMYSHPELIAAWTAAVPHLPLGIREICLDITPAPVNLRAAHRLTLRLHLYDKCTRVFLTCHRDDVDGLILAIDDFYHGEVPVTFTGTLADRCAFFVEHRCTRDGAEIPYEGTWITKEQARMAKIQGAIMKFGIKKTPEDRLKWGDFRKRWETPKWDKERQWGKDTKWAYALVADMGDEDAAVQELKTIAEFVIATGETRLVMRPVHSARRKLQHKVARDLGMTSVSRGQGEERSVVITKNEKSSGHEHGHDEQHVRDTEATEPSSTCNFCLANGTNESDG